MNAPSLLWFQKISILNWLTVTKGREKNQQVVALFSLDLQDWEISLNHGSPVHHCYSSDTLFARFQEGHHQRSKRSLDLVELEHALLHVERCLMLLEARRPRRGAAGTHRHKPKSAPPSETWRSFLRTLDLSRNNFLGCLPRLGSRAI
jgi:hypothetical protein